MADYGLSLPQNVRKAVTRITEKLLVDNHAQTRYHRTRDIRRGNEYMTSLPLQMTFYFNVFFFPLWLISSCVTYQAKYECLDALYKIVIVSLIIMMSVVELIRLYLGYLGNLTEKVPELAGCWLLTILLQFPSTLFLLLNYRATRSMPLEIAMNIVLVVFVICEIIVGGIALKSMVNHQVALFHIQQFVKAEDAPEGKYTQYMADDRGKKRQ